MAKTKKFTSKRVTRIFAQHSEIEVLYYFSEKLIATSLKKANQLKKKNNKEFKVLKRKTDK